MKNTKYTSVVTALLTLLIVISGCKKDLEEFEPATHPKIGDVFIDGFSPGLEYAAFGGSDVKGFEVVSDVVYEGDKAMRFAVPDVGDPAGAYVGGTFFVEGGRDLSEFDALTFWAKASKSASLDVVGFGNDLDENKYVVTISDVAVNTNWKQYIIPLPDASKLTQEKGMFFYSEGPENELGYTFWIDEVKFEKLGTLAQYQPGIQEKQDVMVTAETGQKVKVEGLIETVNLPSGVDQKIEVAPAYFTFSSSNTSVATIDNTGEAMILDAGSAVITAKLGELEAEGSLTIESTGEPILPPTAPVPTRSADSVISMYSNAYTNVTIDTWDTDWEFTTTETDFVQVDGDDIIRYRSLNFVGIEFATQTINASNMTHFHLDIWTPDPTDLPATFKVLLVDFGANNAFDGGDDSSHELTFNAPTLETGSWISLDIPLSSFTGLSSRANLAQLVLSGDLPNVFVDNVYFYISGETTSGGDCTPLDPSMTSIPINFENCESLSGVFEAGDGVTGYPNSNPSPTGINTSNRVYQLNKVLGAAWYSGIFHIFPSNFDMTTNKVFKMKIWSPKANVIVRFQIEKEGGGAVTYQKTATVSNANTWTELSFDFEDQPFIDGFNVYDKIVIIPDDADNGPADGSIYYIDDVELTSGSTGSTEPTTAAPTPTVDPANVISVFSDAYNNISIADFNPNWGQSGTVDQVMIDGNNTLKYSNFNYQGMQFMMNEDLSTMEFVHIDMWTGDATDVKFTPIGGGETLVGLTPISAGQWVSYDIPVADFAGVDFSQVGQLKFDGQEGVTPSNIWIDNIYFYRTAAAPMEPTTAAPTPTVDPANVISVFSDAYNNISIADFNPNWGQSGTVDQVMIDGNNTLKYSNFNYQGTQFMMNEDLSTMEFVHIDMWTFDATDVKFTPISGGETLIGLTPISAGQWVSYDIPVADFAGVDFSQVGQLKFDGQEGVTPSNIWIDNIYFYRTAAAPMEPTTAAPTPTVDPANVISVFSDAYNNISIADFNPNWGQSGTVDQVMIDGNNTLKYSNFNYQGTQFMMNEDLSAMEFVHIDMWTFDATDVKFTPIGGGETLVGLTPISTGQWVSYDIPVADFVGVDFSQVGQLKFDGQDGVTPSNIWIDNIYFYKTSSGGDDCPTPLDPSMTSFPIDFENCEDFSGVFEDGDGVTGFPVANANQTGINNSSRVYQFNKVSGAAWYSGIFHIFPTNFDMTTNKVFKMKIWSPKPNVIVRLQIEKENNQGPIVTFLHTATVTNANTWTELTFDFTNDPLTGPIEYDKIVIIPDDQDNGPADGSVYFIDDLILTN